MLEGVDVRAAAVRRMALWVPDWPVVAAVAEGLAEAHQPVAVHDGRQVTVASAVARAQGVRRGMRRRHAQQTCPELVLVAADDGRDVTGFEGVAAATEAVVAGVEVARPGLLLLPASGAVRYHGTEQALAEMLVTHLAEAGYESQAGAGDGLLAAVLAARSSLMVPPGTSASFLAPQPVTHLEHAATSPQAVAQVTTLVDLLRRLGIHTLGDLAALPAGDVLARFGALGTWAHRLARGEDVGVPALRRTEPDLEVGRELDPPAQRVDVAAFAARALAEQLHTLLTDRGLACGRLRITARTTTGEELVRVWRTDVAGLGGASVARITERVRWQLEGWLTGRGTGGEGGTRSAAGGGTRSAAGTGARSVAPEPAPLVHLGLCAEEVGPAGAEQDRLWGGAGGRDGRARRALHRAQGLLGGEGVLTAVVQGGRGVDDRVGLVPWGEQVAPERPVERPWPGALPPPAPTVVLGEPLPTTLVDRDGAAVRMTERWALSGPPSALDGVAVLGWAGPWPVDERWWALDGRRRYYLQVALGDGRAALLGLEEDRWTIHAWYD